MARVVGIGFKDVGKIYWFDPENIQLVYGDYVVVDTIRGREMGRVVDEVQEVDDASLEHELKSVVRKATAKDIEQYNLNEIRSNEVFPVAKQIIAMHNLDMKIVNCEYTLDSSRLLIYYTAEGRVDFREILKDFAAEFKVRIELRQISQREGAKMLGGLGSCGRVICCKKHLREFDSVTMKMAKDQAMTLSANKITGVCGKLMCCIGYESEFYAEARKHLPNIGDTVATPTCAECKVIAVDYLQSLVKTEGVNGFETWDNAKIKRVKAIEVKD